MRMCGRPSGELGRLGGVIMARDNREFAVQVIDLLKIQPNDKVLKVGFGAGVGIQMLAQLASSGFGAGIDYSKEMVAQATARNSAAIDSGLVNLRQGSVENLPFDANTFDKPLAINSMQVCPDATTGIKEIRRVLKSGGRITLGFSRYLRQPRTGLIEILTAANFIEARMVDLGPGFCALGNKAPPKD